MLEGFTGGGAYIRDASGERYHSKLTSVDEELSLSEGVRE